MENMATCLSPFDFDYCPLLFCCCCVCVQYNKSTTQLILNIDCLLSQCFLVPGLMALRPGIRLQSPIQERENMAKTWRMDCHFSNFQFFRRLFSRISLVRNKSPIMRSYAKCCKVQVASSCLSELFWILLHIVMQSWGFPPSRGLLSEECSIRRATHPRHAWQKPEITIVVSLSCIKWLLMCSESLPIKQIPQIPPSPSINKLRALKGSLSWFLSIIVFIYTEYRPANTGITFKQN